MSFAPSLSNRVRRLEAQQRAMAEGQPIYLSELARRARRAADAWQAQVRAMEPAARAAAEAQRYVAEVERALAALDEPDARKDVPMFSAAYWQWFGQTLRRNRARRHLACMAALEAPDAPQAEVIAGQPFPPAEALAATALQRRQRDEARRYLAALQQARQFLDSTSTTQE